jgi:hypothetical protein
MLFRESYAVSQRVRSLTSALMSVSCSPVAGCNIAPLTLIVVLFTELCTAVFGGTGHATGREMDDPLVDGRTGEAAVIDETPWHGLSQLFLWLLMAGAVLYWTELRTSG